MRNRLRSSGLLVLCALAFAGCNGGSGGGSGIRKCDDADVDCYLDAMFVELDGEDIELRTIDAAAIAAATPPGIASVWAVADGGPGAGLAAWDGAAWTHQYVGGDIAMSAFAVTATDVWSVGHNRQISHFDGAVWTATTDTQGAGTVVFRGVWASAADDAWIVGDGGTVLRWNGVVWAPFTSNTGNTLRALWGAAANDVWAVGDAGTAIHFDGGAWTVVDVGAGANGLTAIWGVGGEWIAGGNAGTLRTGTGTSWGPLALTPEATPTSILDIIGLGSRRWIIGETGGARELLHFDGVAWSMLADPEPAFRSVWGRGTADLWIAGEDFHHGGPPWTAYPHPPAIGGQYHGLHGLASLPAGAPPTIDQPILPMIFAEPGLAEDTTLDWSDPNGCRPSFCFQVCKPEIRCSAAARCSPTVGDGLLVGSTILSLGYRAEPADAPTETLSLEVTPISAPGCEDPLELLETGADGAAVGSASASPQTVIGEPPSSGDLVILTDTLGSGDTTSGLPFLEEVAAQGGTDPCTWSATGLPDTFTMQTGSDVETGFIVCDFANVLGYPFNRPDLIGSYPITVTVTDSLGKTASKDFVVTIVE